MAPTGHNSQNEHCDGYQDQRRALYPVPSRVDEAEDPRANEMSSIAEDVVTFRCAAASPSLRICTIPKPAISSTRPVNVHPE
jgi:hypothetical protein